MADSVETARLIFETVGAEGLDNLKQRLQDVGTQVGELNAAYGRGEVEEKEYAAQAKMLADSQKGLSQAIADVERAFEVARQAASREAQAVAEALRQQEAAAKRAATGIYEFADVYEVLGQDTPIVVQALDSVDHAMMEVEQAAKKAAAATATVVTSAGGTATRNLETGAKSTRNLGMAALEASRGLEDLQYGLAGTLNNIPSLVMALGGTAGLTAVISLSAVGIYQLYKHWDDLTGLFQTRNPFPDATTSAGFLRKALDDTTKAIDTLRDKTGLTLDQTVEYNKLLKDQAGLQAEVAKAEETAANMRALSADANERAQERGAFARKAIVEAGGMKQVVEYLTQSEAKAFGFEDPKVIASVRQGWENAVNEAVRGSKGAIDSLRIAMGADKTGLLGGLATQFELYDPEKVAARKKAEDDLRDQSARGAEETARVIEDMNKQRNDQVKADEDAKKERARQAKDVDDDMERRRKEAAKVVEDARKTEVGRIEGTLGKEFQGRAEVAQAQNLARQAAGAPVARSTTEERQFQGEGIEYALPQAELQRRQRAEMVRTFTARGATPEAAQEAAGNIAEKANTDLARRAADFGRTGLGVQAETLMLTNQLIAQYGQMNSAVKFLSNEVKQQRAHLESAQRRVR